MTDSASGAPTSDDAFDGESSGDRGGSPDAGRGEGVDEASSVVRTALGSLRAMMDPAKSTGPGER